MTKKRAFRTKESHEAEQISRSMVPEFLAARGFKILADDRSNHAQTITARTPDGTEVVMRVQLGWRQGIADKRGIPSYAAAQLIARADGGDPEGALRAKVERAAERHVTHFLIVQRRDEDITYAAMIPREDLVAIWCAERDMSDLLIQARRMGRRTKNHALNGSSPTLYLEDERAPEVPAALWSHSRVIDIAKLPRVPETVPRRGGGGFGDSASNQAVEEAAVERVKSFYIAEGWKVRSIERERCGYDLECKRRREVHHVEVKGVSGAEPIILLTAGEFKKAENDPAFVLFVVTSAVGAAPVLHRYTGAEFLMSFEIRPTQYRAIPLP